MIHEAFCSSKLIIDKIGHYIYFLSKWMNFSPVIKEWNPLLIIMFGTPNFSAHIPETIDIQEKYL